MKKKSDQKNNVSSVATVVFCAIFLAAAFYGSYQYVRSLSSSVVRVGFVLADNLYSHAKAYEGFLRKFSLVEKKTDYVIEPFYFHGDEMLSLEQAVKSLLAWRPDIVVVDGYFATPYVAKTVIDRPVVFIGIDDCVERGLVQSLERPGGNITGVIAGHYDRLAMAAMLQVIKPGACRVLIPYDLVDDVGELVVRDARAVKRMLAKQKIEVTILPVPDMERALELIVPELSTHDVLMTLECDPLDSLIAALIPLCEKTETTFFPGSLGGMEAGSILSFGGHAQVPGKAAFVLVQKIIEHGILPADLSVVAVAGHRQLVINAGKAARQHMQPINEQAIRLRMLRYSQSEPFEMNLKVLP